MNRERLVCELPTLSFKLLLTIILSVFVSISAFAQTSTTGNLEGTVTDPSGALLPGAIVKVTSPILIRSQTVISDSQGKFRFANLTPGKYTLAVEPVSGFSRFEQSNIEVGLSKTTNLDVKMNVQGATATIEVVAESAGAIDLTSTTAGSNLSTEQFSNIPTQRTIQSLYFLAPGAARSGLRDMASGRDRDPSIMGSSGPENNYIT